MSLQVNFTTHGKDLRVTYEDILNSSSANDWALFGYDKGTNDLKVLGTGSGGLEELQDEFVDGKIQYAFVRVVDPNSNLNKFVLIGWCGDGVPESKKGLFNTHLADVSRFLKGYHLQINARSEDDVTPQQIMKRIDEASASKYSYHKETAKGRDLITPLQSAYKKTEIPDIAALQRSSKQEPVAPLQSAYKKTEVPDIATLQRSAPKPESAPKVVFGASSSTPATTSSSTSSIASRWNPQGATSSSSTSTTSSTTTPPASSSSSSWRSGGGSSYVPPTSSNSFNRVAPPASLANYTVDRNEPTMNKAVQMRLEREQREREERARIEQEIKAREAREAEQQQKESAAKQAEERRLQQEREQREQRERDEQERKERERAAAQEAEMSARAAREAAKAREQGEIEAARERARKEEAAREEEARRREEEEARRHEEEEARRREEAEARRKAEEEERERERARRQAEEEEREARRLQEQQEEEARRRQQELEEEVQAATAQSVNLGADALIASSEHPERAAGQAKTAVVLYSYEAAEANEMSLIEGEIIYNVSELDVGWWSGESEDGSRSGLFPANYVELIEHQPTEVPNGSPAAAAGPNVAAAGTPNVHEESHHAAQQGTGASDKPSALALYDYVAGEPNEISFNEGEAIVDIEQITEDWWQGMNQKGDIGLFPANYVELHQ
ncbi:hypothetical protein BGW42_002916 [Actinomortierella wolfii]|nr:hypothetical protein BGW42_002916 [Actinomortierella wolfii]